MKIYLGLLVKYLHMRKQFFTHTIFAVNKQKKGSK